MCWACRSSTWGPEAERSPALRSSRRSASERSRTPRSRARGAAATPPATRRIAPRTHVTKSSSRGGSTFMPGFNRRADSSPTFVDGASLRRRTLALRLRPPRDEAQELAEETARGARLLQEGVDAGCLRHRLEHGLAPPAQRHDGNVARLRL